jgi:hypothetical protein
VSSFGRNDDFLVGERRATTTAGPFDKLRAGSSTALRMTDAVLRITDIVLRMTTDIVLRDNRCRKDGKDFFNDHRLRGNYA